jgi:hypothetical protein
LDNFIQTPFFKDFFKKSSVTAGVVSPYGRASLRFMGAVVNGVQVTALVSGLLTKPLFHRIILRDMGGRNDWTQTSPLLRNSYPSSRHALHFCLDLLPAPKTQVFLDPGCRECKAISG